MATGMNKWTGIGHLGAPAELRYTQKPTPVTSFRIACGERYRDADGNWQEHTEWVNCVLFGKRAEGLTPYLQKGTRVAVEGSMRTRSYTSQKDGQKRWITEIRVQDIILLSTPEGRQIRDEQEVPPKGSTVDPSGDASGEDVPAPSDNDAPEDFAG